MAEKKDLKRGVLRLDDYFHIDIYSNRWTLKYKGPKVEELSTPERDYHELGMWYYHDLKSALKGYARHSLKDSNSFQDVLDKLDYIEQLINNL